jgi:hypothetical protein
VSNAVGGRVPEYAFSGRADLSVDVSTALLRIY